MTLDPLLLCGLGEGQQEAAYTHKARSNKLGKGVGCQVR